MRILKQGGGTRRTRTLLPAAILALGIVGLAPAAAQAQFFNWGGGGWSDGNDWGNGREWGTMEPAQVYRTIGERGFRMVAPLRRNGSVFIADVIDRRGRRERLIVAAADAQILQRFMLNDRRQPRGAAFQGSDDIQQQMEQVDRGDAVPPIPPGSIPNAGSPNPVYGSVDPGFVTEPIAPRVPRRLPKSPKPRLVEQSPDTIDPAGDQGVSQPTRLKVRPTEPLRLPSAGGTAAEKPIPSRRLEASRPVDPVVKQLPPASAPSQASASPAPAPVPDPSAPAPSTRMRDPLAIPRAEPKAAVSPTPSASASAAPTPVRIAPAASVGAPSTPAPVKPSAAPAKTGDVPVAPLD